MVNDSSTVMDSLLLMNQQAEALLDKESSIFEYKGDWRGLGFIVNGQRVVAAMNEVTEIMDFPNVITVIPDTQPWIVGLANLQGEILPITDLQYFLGGTPVKTDYLSKVLVIKHQGKFIGLLVPTVLGIQHLPEKEKQKYSIIENLLDVFIYEIFNLKNEQWPVFNMAALINDKRFLKARIVNKV